MNKFAQILNNKVHWIFSDEMSLQELYLNKFNPEQIKLIDITSNQQPIDEGWDYIDGQFIDPNPPKTLEQLKTEKWQQIKQARDNAEQAGVPYLGKILDSDSLSVQRITVAVQTAQLAISAGQEFTIEWTCQDNSTLMLNAQQVVGIPMSLAAQSNSLHQKARGLRELIDMATTKEELELITWE